MPRASKKKQKKAEDFKKVKLKVGKKKAPASNATDTSFTARAIVVSAQSISADKRALLTNSRNHTLKELLAQLRHYSVVTRRDGIAGLEDFVKLHPAALRAELGPIVEASVRLIIDADAGVRRQLLRLYTVVLPELEPRELAPFVPLAVAFTCSAMTHISEGIRADAVRFLDVLADTAPDAVAQLAPRVLPGFFSMLDTTAGAADGSTDANARTALLTQASRLAIMRSCRKFLAVCTRPLAPAADALWFMAPSRIAPATPAELLFFPDTSAPFSALNLFGEAATDSAPAAAAAVRTQSVVALARLFPFLQATWVEAVAVFSAGRIGADDLSLELCAQVMLILQVLWRSAYTDAISPQDPYLPAFLHQCAVLFPFTSNDGDAAAEDAILALNVRVCELAALVRQGMAEPDVELARVLRRVIRFVLQTLDPKPGRVARTLRHEHFVELLPAIWRLARCADRKDADRLLTAVMRYSSVCPLSSPSKALCIRFLARIVDAQWARQPVHGAPDLAGSQLSELATAWVLGLPKLLWQLRDRNINASAAAADTLRMVCQRTRLLDETSADTLQTSLSTLFCVSVPGKGPVHGPFRLYPPALQQTVLEIVACCPARSPRLAQAVRAAIATAAPARGIQVLAAEIG
ncbi:rRNA processing protein [Coemansia sp. RSA 2711]|nr:rRNA processing protein [Coemansia sp. RSA 2711]KAJ1849406.1 rRNA processing protein [Coemansia sp. RSA 2708]